MKNWKRILIIIVIMILGISYMCISQYKKEIKSIDEQLATKYYDEKDVNFLENLFIEYNKIDYSNEDAKKVAVYALLKTFYSNHFSTCADTHTDIIIDDINDNSFLNEMTLYKLDKDIIMDGITIKAGDYHALASHVISVLNQEGIEHSVANDLMKIEDDANLIIQVLVGLSYTIVILGFIFLTKFTKDKFIKNIIIYGVILLVIFIVNIVLANIVVNVINYLGTYRNYGFYGTSGYYNLLDSGLISISKLLIIFIITVILNLLVNYKSVKKYLKSKK